LSAGGTPPCLRTELEASAALVFAHTLPGGVMFGPDISRSYAQWLEADGPISLPPLLGRARPRSAFRLDSRVVYPATAVATLLVADAWFDVTTSATTQEAVQALILALVVELPAAAFSLYVAHRVGRRVRELAHLDHVAGPHPAVPDRAHPALPSESSSPAELPPQE